MYLIYLKNIFHQLNCYIAMVQVNYSAFVRTQTTCAASGRGGLERGGTSVAKVRCDEGYF